MGTSISTPSDWISTIYGLLDSSHQDESNGGKISPIGSILAELWRKYWPIKIETTAPHVRFTWSDRYNIYIRFVRFLRLVRYLIYFISFIYLFFNSYYLSCISLLSIIYLLSFISLVSVVNKLTFVNRVRPRSTRLLWSIWSW